jgi:hypothetical protein
MRPSFGQVIIDHKGTKIPTSVGSRGYEGLFGGENSMINFTATNGNIPEGYAHRPDLIANLYLDTADAWWVVCERNAIFDVFEQLKSGSAIRLPTSL